MNALFEVYEAFKTAGVPEEQAKRASEAVNKDEGRFLSMEGRLTNIEKEMSNMQGRLTNIEGRLNNVEKDLYLLKWMLGFVLAMQLAILLKLFF